MTKALFRDAIRAMQKTISRFISIVIIVALGVGFFTGLRAVSPGMALAAAQFFGELNLADLVIVSNAGFDENDRQAVLALPGVQAVTLSRFVDGLLFDPPPDAYTMPEMAQSMTGGPYVLRIIGHDFEGGDRLNQLRLVDGRLPEAPNEAVVSEYAWRMEAPRFNLGNQVRVQGDGENIDDFVSHDTFTIVGVIHTPEFVSMELGPSQVGSGELSGYIYIPDSAFLLETRDLAQYTTMFIGVENPNNYAPFTDEYDYLVRRVRETVEAASADIIAQRANRIAPYLAREIEEGRAMLEAGLADGMEELERAREQLAEIDYIVANAPRLREEAEAQLAQAREDYAQGRSDFDTALAEYNERLETFMGYHAQVERELAQHGGNPMDEFIHYRNTLQMRQESWEMANISVQAGRSAVRVANIVLDSGDPTRIQNAIDILGIYFPMDPAEATVPGLRGMLDEAEADLAAQEEQLEVAAAQLEEAREELARWEPMIGRLEEYEQAERQMLDAYRQLNEAQMRLRNAPLEIAAGERELLHLELVVETQAFHHLRYAEETENAQRRRENYERMIRQGEILLETLPYTQWITNNRDHFPGYVNYGETADSMEQFAIIFPVLFFLIAALVSWTTMSRMVSEERTQMGVLKAAGYSAGSIAFKYLFYAFTAGLLGTLIGATIGFIAIPQAVFGAYQILYLIPTMPISFFADSALIGFAAAMASTVLAASFAVLLNVRFRPAVLMRPKAPKVGKRVFLEYIPFIWRNMGFNGKVTTRNLMRNKMRALMTFLGIMGCTALLLTGFGIGNSIGTMLDRQFGPESIMSFDAQALLQTPMRAGDQQILDVFNNHAQEIDSFMPIVMQQMYAGTDAFGRQIPVRMIVPANYDRETLSEFVELRDFRSGNPLTISNQGVFINGKTAELMNLSVGDEITLHWGTQVVDITVAGIAHNYIYHWIYMTPLVFEQAFGVQETLYNMVMINVSDELRLGGGNEGFFAGLFGRGTRDAETLERRTGLARALSDTAEVVMVSYNQTIVDSVGAQLRVMRNVVMVVFVAASGALAFVVLYNLNNINIYERIRELATIKVLGFHDREADMFIYRENIIVTILGIGAGLLLGIPIFVQIILAGEIESMMFVRTLAGWNFIAAALVTAVFAIAINLLMHKKIKDIVMVEALKSVE